MKLSKKSIIRKVATLALMTAIVFGSAVPAFADTTTVSQGITAGTMSASLSTPSFASKTSQHIAVNSDAATVLSVDDSTGNGAGWHVSMISTALGGVPSGTIPATAISANTLGNIQVVAGVAGPTAGASAELSGARTVMTTAVATGQGTYTEDIGLRIVLPADLHAGTYTGTLTITISPGA